MKSEEWLHPNAKIINYTHKVVTNQETSKDTKESKTKTDKTPYDWISLIRLVQHFNDYILYEQAPKSISIKFLLLPASGYPIVRKNLASLKNRCHAVIKNVFTIFRFPQNRMHLSNKRERVFFILHSVFSVFVYLVSFDVLLNEWQKKTGKIKNGKNGYFFVRK